MLYTQTLYNVPGSKADETELYRKTVSKLISSLDKEIKDEKLPLMNVAFHTKDLDAIQKKANEIRKKFKKVILIGIGGSSLGAKTLGTVSLNPNYMLFMDSLDSKTVNNILNNGVDLEDTMVISVGKSGKTIEGLCQTTIVINQMQQHNIDIKSHFLIITEDKDSPLMKIAKKFDIEVMFHPSDIGGRYSYLSLVGLLPSAILGLNIEKVRKGAKHVLNETIKDGIHSDVGKAIISQLFFFDSGVVSNIMMHYVDNFNYLIEWYRQLFSESIGKDGVGITPIEAVGTKDQHSQLQLYLGGPKDKFYSFFGMERYEHTFRLDTSFVKDLGVNLDGKYLGDILAIEQDSTVECLVNQKLPVRTIKFEKFDEESLGGIMMQMMIETIIICRAKNVDPFGQALVELKKVIAKEKLSK